MNAKIKRKWVSALRSGDYTQGKNKLAHRGSYCCLGVLCDLYTKETGKKWRDRKDEDYQQEQLPKAVQEWADLDENPGVRGIALKEEDGYAKEIPSLAEMNDNGFTFAEIAAVISKQL